MKKAISSYCTCLVLTSDHNILMQRRGSKQTYPNFWDVSVAGHISSGETIHQGAIREIKEEIGLTILHNDLEFITTVKMLINFKWNNRL